MAIQQKLALTQRLEDLAFDQEQTSRGHGVRLNRRKSSNPRVSPATGPSVSKEDSVSLAPSGLSPPADPAASGSPAGVVLSAVALVSPTSHRRPPSPPPEASSGDAPAPENSPLPETPSRSPASAETPPSAPPRVCHSQWSVGTRTHVVDSSLSPAPPPGAGLFRHYTPDSHASTTTPRQSHPGSAPSSPYQSPLQGVRRFTWSLSPRSRPLSSLARPSFFSSSYSYSSASGFSSPSSYLSSGTSGSYGHSSHYTPLYPRHYSSYRPQH